MRGYFVSAGDRGGHYIKQSTIGKLSSYFTYKNNQKTKY